MEYKRYKGFFSEDVKPYERLFETTAAPTSTSSATTGAGIPQNLQPEIPYRGPDKEEDTPESKKIKKLLAKKS